MTDRTLELIDDIHREIADIRARLERLERMLSGFASVPGDRGERPLGTGDQSRDERERP